MDITGALPYFQTFLAFCNMIIIVYGGYKFLNKPHDTLSDEVKQLNTKIIEQNLEIKELKRSLDSCFEKHREQDKTNAVFKKIMLLFANFEIAFCQHTNYVYTDDLIKAQNELQDYLAGK